jgi:hypothetical protein
MIQNILPNQEQGQNKQGQALEGIYKDSDQSSNSNSDQQNQDTLNQDSNKQNQEDNNLNKSNKLDSNEEKNMLDKAKKELDDNLKKALEQGKYSANEKSELDNVKPSKNKDNIQNHEYNNKVRDKSLLNKSKQSNSNGIGNQHIEDYIQERIEKLMEHKIDWYDILRDRMSKILGDEETKSKKINFFVPDLPLNILKEEIEQELNQSIFIPGNEYTKPSYWLFGMDVSGSVPLEHKKIFLSEIYGMLRIAEENNFNLMIDIVYVDTDKCNIKQYSSSNPNDLLNDIQTLGVPQGGGTNLSKPLYEYIDELRKNEELYNTKLRNISFFSLLTDGELMSYDIRNFQLEKLYDKIPELKENDDKNSKNNIIIIISEQSSGFAHEIKRYTDYYPTGLLATEEKDDYKMIEISSDMSL